MRHETRCMQACRAEQAMPARGMGLGGRLLQGTILAIGFALAAPMTVSAHDTLANVNTDNVYRGYVGKQGPRVIPWVRTFFLDSSICARFQVESQYTDLEMVVVSTNPSKRYRNDNGAAPNPCGATCPIVRIPETPFAPGYFTVHISPNAGASIPGEFLLRLTTRPFGDPICSPATTEF